MGVEFIENKGPVFKNPIKSKDDIHNLIEFNPENLSYVYQAVAIKRALPENIPLIGFCGSPWTLAVYSIEGHSSKDFKNTINLITKNKEASHLLLSKLTDACFLYLEASSVGADVIQIFDSWLIF